MWSILALKRYFNLTNPLMKCLDAGLQCDNAALAVFVMQPIRHVRSYGCDQWRPYRVNQHH
ncbi:Uncharacterised protein [Mycobacteroides abscessus subsp. abscessus]|nr:Uncharacterised protein [Mycobacteroides abscessus subsp. abscessus]